MSICPVTVTTVILFTNLNNKTQTNKKIFYQVICLPRSFPHLRDNQLCSSSADYWTQTPNAAANNTTPQQNNIHLLNQTQHVIQMLTTVDTKKSVAFQTG